MRSALLLPSQNALDQLSRFPRPSQERINYLVQEFRQQISNLMSLLVALRKVDLTHAVHCGITDEPQRIGHWLERIRKVQRFNQVLYPIKCTWSDFRKRSALKNLKPEEVF